MGVRVGTLGAWEGFVNACDTRWYPRLTKGWAFEIGEPAIARVLDRVTPQGVRGLDFKGMKVHAGEKSARSLETAKIRL